MAQQGWWATAVQHGGKEMSYLNVYDTEAAWQLVHSLGEGPAAVVIKHANPCGVAVADDILTAYTRAHECDPVSAFGGIVAVNRPVTLAVAEALGPVFTEVLVAPSYDADALAGSSRRRRRTCASSRPPAPAVPELTLRSVDGGYLVQTADHVTVDRVGVAGRHRPPAHRGRVGRPRAGLAGGRQGDLQRHRAGEGRRRRRHRLRPAEPPRRRHASRARRPRAGPPGGVYASDAFFPFPDGLEGAIEAGATCVVQPGGSIRDDEVIAAANEAGLAMVFTGERHFRH